MAKGQGKDVPGDSLASASMVTKMLVRQATALHQVNQAFDRWADEELYFEGFSVRPPSMTRNEWLVIGRANQAGRQLVAFHGDASFLEAIVGWCERAINGSLRWSDDRFAK